MATIDLKAQRESLARISDLCTQVTKKFNYFCTEFRLYDNGTWAIVYTLRGRDNNNYTLHTGSASDDLIAYLEDLVEDQRTKDIREVDKMWSCNRGNSARAFESWCRLKAELEGRTT